MSSHSRYYTPKFSRSIRARFCTLENVSDLREPDSGHPSLDSLSLFYIAMVIAISGASLNIPFIDFSRKTVALGGLKIRIRNHELF